MAKAVISNIRKTRVGFIKTSDFFNAKIYDAPGTVKINETIPFRVKFTNIGIPGYGPNNIPGIGIQVIGLSNYIL